MLSAIFAFAPVPLTNEVNPLAVAADLARRRQAEQMNLITPTRHRIQPAVKPSAPESLIAA